MRRNDSGSQRRSHRSLVMVKLARGTLPQASAQAAAPPGSAARSSSGVGCRLGVVPQLGGPDDITVIVEDDGAMLLRGNRNGRRLESGTPAMALARENAILPGVGVLFAPGWRGRGMRCAARSDEDAGVRVAHLDLARRRRGVDADDQGHYRTPSSNSVTS